MSKTYFDVKRELKKIYELGQKTIKNKDIRHTNYIVFNLEQLEKELKNNSNINSFGIHILNRDIKHLKRVLDDGIKVVQRQGNVKNKTADNKDKANKKATEERTNEATISRHIPSTTGKDTGSK